ncbi:MAG: hypothetical protein KatS3mg033_1348 [Thermonema sp.]|uniref:alpha/beta fold hydrolase n=1 Tax=Thermonema sp. TaxID=2231181 RepID=UPI0021DECA43|nr:alpha/beta fold hydrolase [Thermonema sp.]GIV39548.1 MAG: hypothetical protein KatS3mg033_1348 [Thermonema sp.]
MQLRKKVLGALLFIVGIGVFCQLSAQSLPRRPFIGLDLRWNTEEEVLEVARVHAGSAAEKAGILPGDRLLHLDDTPLKSYTQLLELVRRNYKVGDKVTLSIRRGGQLLSYRLRLGKYPTEQAPDFAIDYREIKTPQGRLRCIVTRPPNSQAVPAVLFIQGIACQSIDTPFDTQRPYTQLLYELTRQGVATIRVEKFGIGDSEGPDCIEVDFETERQAFLQALRAVKQYDFVDSTQVFLLGHSVGGILAVQIANHEPVKGIIVYGTVGRRWTDYLLESRRRLFMMKGKPEAEIDDYLNGINRCNVEYFVLHRPKSEVANANPAYERYLRLFDIRSDQYWFQLQEVNVPAEWSRYDGFVLSLWGEFDVASLEEDHQMIAHIVNKRQPERAVYVRVPQADHGMRWTTSYREVVAPYNPVIGHIVNQWIQAVCQAP